MKKKVAHITTTKPPQKASKVEEYNSIKKKGESEKQKAKRETIVSYKKKSPLRQRNRKKFPCVFFFLFLKRR